MYQKVSLIVINPIMDSEKDVRMTQIFGWNDPDRLVDAFIADLQYASHGFADYHITERILIDDFLPMEDGFKYTPEGFIRCWRRRGGFHQPDRVFYHDMLSNFDLVDKINNHEIDEIWTIGHPYAGFYESRMAGPGAFWCNSPPLMDIRDVNRRFVVMAFNFERGVGEMLESYGHRAESIMEYVHRHIPDSHDQNLWRRFTRYDKIATARAEVGNIHFAPNSERDYDWGNRRKVLSHSRAWYDFPDLSAPPRLENCSEWGDGDIRLHHLWWFHHLPSVGGQTGSVSNNWWEYILDANRVL
jgi:hypothetical protein